MHDQESFDGGDGTVFRDVIMLALLGFVTIVVLLLPHLNPPTLADAEVTASGNVIVEVRWPDGLDADVDLWVEAPGDRPVGYSNRGGRVFNLLRDDLGDRGDETDLNYEVAFTRGTPPGDYTINLHLYRNPSGQFPVEAEVRVGVRQTAASGVVKIASKRAVLATEGQEVTVLRFKLDGDGRVVPGSLHDLPRPLRSA
jgi:hypothetical protein